MYSFALSQFFYFVDVPSPQHCKSLALVLHCFRFLEHCIAIAAKTPPALSHRSYRCYIYATPLGSVSRNYRNVVCPPPLMALRTLRALNLGKNVRYFTTTQTTCDNKVRAVRCEQKIQPRITQICTNGDNLQKFFGLPKKIFVWISEIGYAELKVRGKK